MREPHEVAAAALAKDILLLHARRHMIQIHALVRLIRAGEQMISPRIEVDAVDGARQLRALHQRELREKLRAQRLCDCRERKV